MSEQDIEDALCELVDDFGYELQESEETDRKLDLMGTYKELGILSSNKGLVISDSEGNEFQISIVKSK